jgi:hypothetical protein
MKSGVQSETGMVLAVVLAGACLSMAQEAQPAAEQGVQAQTTQGQAVTEQAAPAYKPKFAGDPARSEAEAGALGYIRTVLMAERLYKKKHGSYATSLAGLVNTGSFTRRLTKTDRGEYDVSFHSKTDGFSVALTPKQFDAGHRAFYSDDSGAIRAEDGKAPTADSDRVK